MKKITLLWIFSFLTISHVVQSQVANENFATSSAFAPTCPYISPGYVPDGSFIINISNIPACPAPTYDITATPVAGSGPLGSNPPIPVPNSYPNVTPGDYLFFFAGAGNYQINISRNTMCTPAMMADTSFVVTVPDGTDNIEPIWRITTLIDSITPIADNNVFTPATLVANLDDVDETFTEVFRMEGIDNCDGRIRVPGAVTATATEGTMVTVTPNYLYDKYLIDIVWGPGSPAMVTLTGQDASGNTGSLTLQRTVFAIPTLGQWGIIILGLSLMIIGIAVFRTRSKLSVP